MYQVGDRVTNTFTGATGLVFGVYYSDGVEFYRVGYSEGSVENLTASELRFEPLSPASTSEWGEPVYSEWFSGDQGSAVMSCGCSDYHYADCPIRTGDSGDWYPGWDQD